MSATTDELREEVRRRYAESARAVSESSHDCGCGSGACSLRFPDPAARRTGRWQKSCKRLTR